MSASAAGGDSIRIVIAGGGTGGHLYPGLAIADEVRSLRPDAVIVFVGTRGHIEERVVPASGYPFETISISGIRRAVSVALVLFPFKLGVALVQSWFLLRRLRPDVVVGTGGYVCGPVVFVASLLGIRTLIQEQNSYPGVTTRLLARRADEVHITFEETRKFLKRHDRVFVSGNPTRRSLESCSRQEATKIFAIDGNKKTLCVVGGSQGSVAINNAVLGILGDLLNAGIQVLWQTGKRDYARISSLNEIRDAVAIGSVRVHPYIDQMGQAYAACDLVLARAGATTLAEVTRLGKPSVLVPLPTAAADHQTENARSMEAANAAVMVPERETGQHLLAVLKDLFGHPDRLQVLAEGARRLGKPDAASTLANAVLRLAGK
jgi:UDP-N-acetylglucosamine--N-acetylmuramyl-(pentapeptide) pyrophosphoryl-undecaprenol N-acetylglucosamine transferase